MDLYPVDNWWDFCLLVKWWALEQFEVASNSNYIDEQLVCFAGSRQDKIDLMWEEIELKGDDDEI
jgi:hypothetical protein